MNDQAVLKKQV